MGGNFVARVDPDALLPAVFPRLRKLSLAANNMDDCPPLGCDRIGVPRFDLCLQLLPLTSVN